jgi:diacylglycerol kinase family enzyme
VNEVLNGISGADITLGIIPIGFNNVFANLIGVPDNWLKAIDVIAARRIEHFDLGTVVENKECFIMSSGIGAENVLSTKTRNRSFLSDDNFFGNDSSFFSSLLKDQPTYKLQFVIDRKYAITANASSASIINSRFFKFGYLDGVDFDYKDRMLDLVVLSNVKNKKLVSKIIKNSSSLDGEYFTLIRGREIHVDSFSEQMKVHVDGRVLAKTPCTFKISPTKQKVITSKRQKS